MSSSSKISDWLDNGTYLYPKTDRGILFDKGVTTVATNYSISRNLDSPNRLQINIPTGATFEWSANDVTIGTLGTTGIFGALSYSTLTATSAILSGAFADGANTAVKICNTIALTTAGGKIVSFYSDNVTTERAYIDYLGSFNAGPGTALLPAYSFAGDPNTGMWWQNADTLAFSTGGSERLRFGTVSLITNLTIRPYDSASLLLSGAIADGASAVGTIIDQITSLTIAGGKLISIRNATVEKAYIDYLGSFNAGPGTTLLPAYSFVGDPNTGIWNYGANQVGVALNGSTYYIFGATTFYTAQNIYPIGASYLGINGAPVDGASAVATVLNANAALVTPGAKLVSIQNATVEKAYIDYLGGLTISQGVGTSGVANTGLTVTGGAHTGITAATEDIGINFNLSATKTWATGAGPLAIQREFVIQAPTYSGNVAGALAITNAYTEYITGAPIVGANLSITNSWALGVGGATKFILGAAENITIDAGATDHTGANVITMDLDVNSASVNALSFDIDVGTALSAVETVNGIKLDIDGNAGDDAGSFLNGIYLTSANTSSGNTTAINIVGNWDLPLAMFIEPGSGTTTPRLMDLNITATSYLTATGAIDLVRSGAITGVDTETMIDFQIAPSFTLTEPGAGTFTMYGANIDLSGISVTAGAGTSVLAALRLVANADADAGTNYALWVDSGVSRFDGAIIGNQGTDIASTTTIVIPKDGNVFELTGVNSVTLITKTGFQDGHEITLVANANVTITHGTATSGNDITIKLAGAGNFDMTADDTLTLVLCTTTAGGQAWREKCRSVI